MKTIVAVRQHDHEPLPLLGRMPRLPPRPVPLLLLRPLPLWAPRNLEPLELSWGAVGEAWGAAAPAQGSANVGDRLVAVLGPWALSLEEGNLGSQVLGPVRTRRKEPATTVRTSMRTQPGYRLWTPPRWNSRSTGLRRL